MGFLWRRKFSRLPIVVRSSPGRLFGRWMLWVLSPICLLLILSEGGLGAALSLLLIVPALVAARSWDRIQFKLVTVERDRVRYQWRSGAKEEAWEEPLSAYRGIEFYEERESGVLESHSGGINACCVKLVHRDPAREVLIKDSRLRFAARIAWETASETLGLPRIGSAKYGESGPAAVDIEREEALYPGYRDRVAALQRHLGER